MVVVAIVADSWLISLSLLQVMYGAAAARASPFLFLHHEDKGGLVGTGTYISNMLERFGRTYFGVDGLRPRALRRHWATLIDHIDPHGELGLKALAAKAMGTSVKVLNERYVGCWCWLGGDCSWVGD